MVKMAIKIEINITNKWLYSLMVIGIFLVLGVGVLAYNSDMRVGNPPVMGHSAGEINVENSTGGIVSLQDTLDEGILTDVYKCPDSGPPCGGGGGPRWVVLSTNQTLFLEWPHFRRGISKI